MLHNQSVVFNPCTMFQRDLEDQRELAQNRMVELDTLNSNYKECLQQVEKLKMELSTLPEYVVVETTEHKCLQVKFFRA